MKQNLNKSEVLVVKKEEEKIEIDGETS